MSAGSSLHSATTFLHVPPLEAFSHGPATPSPVHAHPSGLLSTAGKPHRSPPSADTTTIPANKMMPDAADVIRTIYSDKLRASVSSIIDTLSTELPQDHIFKQLLADDTTYQYCRVRLAEVVEGFLYSTQAQQYHWLAMELARREKECALAQQRVEEVEMSLVTMRASGVMGDGAARSALTTPRPSAGGEVGGLATPSSVNPMDEEEARRELMMILSQATHDAELQRCRGALAAVTSLVDAAHEEPRHEDKLQYANQLTGELFRCIHSLLAYVDSELEGQERLRGEILLHGGPSSPAPVGSAPRPVLSGSDRSPPRALDTTRRDGRSEIQQERQRLHKLAERLRDGQILAARLLDRLGQADSVHRAEVSRLERALEVAKGETDVAASAAAGAKELQASLEVLRKEYQDAMAAERAGLRDQLAEVHEQLAKALQEAQEARREGKAAKARATTAEQQLAEVEHDHETAIASVDRLQAELREAQEVARSRQAELSMLRAQQQKTSDALLNTERELLCVRVESAMAGLEAAYQESKVSKMEVLERDGYRPLAHQHGLLSTAQHEHARHATAQAHLAEAATQERDTATRAAMEAMGTLLRSMWADDAVESSLQDSQAKHLSSSSALIAAPGSATHSARGRSRSSSSSLAAEGGGGSTAAKKSAAYRVPATMTAMTAALEQAYQNVRAQYQNRQQSLDQLHAILVEREIEVRALQATEAQLRELLKAEQAKEDHWKAEIEQWSTSNPMRDLLARQDSLLRAVSEERNALRKQWQTLNVDYIELEQRNGQLHARCAQKEYENARLTTRLQTASLDDLEERGSVPAA